MGIYSRVFINFYNFYAKSFSPNRSNSAYFLSLIQLAQIAIFINLSGITGIISHQYSHKQSYYFICILTLPICFFNFFFYNDEKIKKLLISYNELTDKQKIRSRSISMSFSILTFIGYLFSLFYLNYLHSLNTK